MRKLIVGVVGILVTSTVFGHHLSPDDGGPGIAAFEALMILLLCIGAIMYAAGVRTLWRKAGIGHGIGRGDAVRFALGWGALGAALMSPIDAMAGRSFALHMLQHEILMVVAAPLIVLGRPIEAFAWASPRSLMKVATRLFRTPAARAVWALLTGALSAWTVHAVALWAWHVPGVFKAALMSPSLHVLQHLCFFVSALGFWWATFGAKERTPSAASMAGLFTTMLHTSALGALLTFAPTAWYSLGEPRYGLSALEDQQLGGLIMWVPGSLVYLIAALAIVRWWLLLPRAAARP